MQPTFTGLLHGGTVPGLGLPALDSPGGPEGAVGVPELLAEGVAGVPGQEEVAGHWQVQAGALHSWGAGQGVLWGCRVQV